MAVILGRGPLPAHRPCPARPRPSSTHARAGEGEEEAALQALAEVIPHVVRGNVGEARFDEVSRRLHCYSWLLLRMVVAARRGNVGEARSDQGAEAEARRRLGRLGLGRRREAAAARGSSGEARFDEVRRRGPAC